MLFFQHALLPQGWAQDVRITLADGMITGVERLSSPQPGDSRHAIGLPGLPNLHSHGFQRGMAGLAERRGPASDSFWTWREVMYHFLATMTPEDIEAITALAFMEMLEAGFTRVGEFHYLHNAPDGHPYADPAELSHRIVAAAVQTGINLSLLPVFYAHANFGSLPPTPGQRRFITSLDGFARLWQDTTRLTTALPGATHGLAPHSLRAVDPVELLHLLQLAPEGPVHMHIAEQRKEVEDCRAWSGTTPVTWLLDNAPVDARWCLIHATHMNANETAALARSGATAGLCPITEANLGDGIFNAPEWLHADGLFGIGTDSNICIDAATEMRQLEYAQRLAQQSRNIFSRNEGDSTGAALFAACHRAGEALGVPAEGISVGQSADIIALYAEDLTTPHCDRILDEWIFATRHSQVETVWVRGNICVAQGRHVARDDITARYHKAMKRLVNR